MPAEFFYILLSEENLMEFSNIVSVAAEPWFWDFTNLGWYPFPDRKQFYCSIQ